jgi:spore maturation protein CgeB
MQRHLHNIIGDPALARALATAGLETIAARHTCRHRVDELFDVLRKVGTTRVTHQLAVPEPAQ